MKYAFTSPRTLLLTAMIVTLGVLAYGHPQRPADSVILAADEGAVIGTHYIKADPKTGSRRLGAGLQRLPSGQGIPMHVHEKEDELLFVHSGSGVGAVGDEREGVTAGTTLYIPQGTWHGIQSRGEMEVLWVVSPPLFAENLRQVAATKASSGGKISSGDLDAIRRSHGYRDERHFFLPRLTTTAAILGFVAVFVALLSRVRPFRSTSLYGLGALLASTVTTFALGPGHLPLIVFVVGVLMISVAVFAGALGGFYVQRLTGPATGSS